PRFQVWKASWIACPPILNWMYHKPTMEELNVPSAGEVVASCLPTAELTILFPAAIAARLSPQEANAPALSPIVTAAHITSFVQVSAKIVFIIILLLSFERFEQGGEMTSCSPKYPFAPILMPRPPAPGNANRITAATFSQHGLNQ